VRGKVTRVADFGAVVGTGAPASKGLIRLFDLDVVEKSRGRRRMLVKPGELVEAVILNVSGRERRIGLGLKRRWGIPGERAKEVPVGSVVGGPPWPSGPTSGAFVELGGGLRG